MTRCWNYSEWNYQSLASSRRTDQTMWSDLSIRRVTDVTGGVVRKSPDWNLSSWRSGDKKKPWPHPRTYMICLWFEMHRKCDWEVLGNLPCEVVGCGTCERACFLATYGNGRAMLMPTRWWSVRLSREVMLEEITFCSPWAGGPVQGWGQGMTDLAFLWVM